MKKKLTYGQKRPLLASRIGQWPTKRHDIFSSVEFFAEFKHVGHFNFKYGQKEFQVCERFTGLTPIQFFYTAYNTI
jgi:hypothetical protein